MPRIYTRTYCQVDACGKRAVGRSMCEMHYRRWKRWGDPRIVHPNNPSGPSNSNWRGGSYFTTHATVARERGRASEHGCVQCERAADHWAYTHGDPDERVSPQGWPYSLDIDYYVPMCRFCHKRFDVSRPA